MAGLSIVIPTLGSAGALEDVLAGLERQQRVPAGAEVLVVVDAAGAPCPPLAAPGQLGPFRLEVLRAARAGASGARNAGWRAARAPLVIFLDDDIVPARTLVAEHLAWHDRHPGPEVGVLGNVRWSPRVRINPFMRWLEMGIQFDYRTITGPEVGWERFYSCNVSLKRDILMKVGGFDEDRFPYGYEDLELGRRLAEVGFRLLYNPAARGEHLKTETLETWRRNLQRIAVAERRFTEMYPDVEPFFYQRFREAADAPPARGRSARLARFIPPKTPLLGRVVWFSYDLVCRQRLAPEFLAEWDAAG